MRRALFPSSVWLGLLLSCATWPAFAQSTDPIFANLTFSFSSPGARSLALGGAFTAVADDATAAFANPAGLTLLPSKQVTLEFRRSTVENSFVSGGTFDSNLSDPFSGLILDDHTDSTSRPAFVSIMVPRGRWAIGAYRHELSRFTFDAQTAGLRVNTIPIAATVGSLKLDIVNYGVSAAANMTDVVSIGGGISYFRNSLTARRDTLGVGAFSDTTADESAFGGNLGFLMKLGRLSIGGAYRRSPKFDVRHEINGGVFNPQVDSATTQFAIPDVYALGMAYRVSNTFLISADIQEVKYKTLTQDLFIPFRSIRPLEREEFFQVEDADEFRLGAEKVFIRTRPSVIAVRFGAWYEPAHRVQYRGPDVFQVPEFPQGESQVHATAGVGLVFGRAFQIDAGIDYAKNSRIFSLSLVKPF